MQIKSVPFECKVNADHRTFEGHAAVFGNVDEGGDRIKKGAFKKTLQERFPKGQIKTLWLHRDPLGMPTELREDDQGLFFRSTVSKTALGNDALELMHDGVVNQMSFGYDTVKSGMIMEDDEEIRELLELKLYEISPVLFPMNEATAITAVKQLIEVAPLPDNVKALLSLAARMGIDSISKAVVPYQKLPLAPRTRPWDRSAADKRVRTWADATDEPNAKYRKAFLWYDSDATDNFGSYKLQIGDIISGELKAVPRAIFAVAGVLQGARGGVDIPDTDAAKVKKVVEKYYAAMRSEFDDDDIIAPWKSKEANIALIQTEQAARDFLARLEDMKALVSQPVSATGKNEPLPLSLLDPFCALTKDFQLHL